MAEKVKSSVWVLRRLNIPNGPTYPLNRDEVTTIGRDIHCDISCDSNMVSRNHCSITIDLLRNRVMITNKKSLNGTFVNNFHLNEEVTRELRSNDVLGIGCNQNMWDAKDPQRYYLLQLKNLEEVVVEKERIDLTEDDDMEVDSKEFLHRQMNIKRERQPENDENLQRLKRSPVHYNDEEPVIDDIPPDFDAFANPIAGPSRVIVKPEPVSSTNGIAKNVNKVEDVVVEPKDARSAVNESAAANPLFIIDSTALDAGVTPSYGNSVCSSPAHDIYDDDIHFSQQIAFNIKQEVDQSFEYDSGDAPPPRIVNDDPIMILDDDDEPNAVDNNWGIKLSQVEGQLVEKLMKKTKTDKRKSSKCIEPQPQLSKRRRSVAETKSPKSVSGKTSVNDKAPPARRKSISDDVKSKLAELAAKVKVPSAVDRAQAEAKSKTRPKVKVSKSRSDFLTADQPPGPPPILARRKSFDAKQDDNVRSNKDKIVPQQRIKPGDDNLYETVLKPKGTPITRISRVPSTITMTSIPEPEPAADSSRKTPKTHVIVPARLGHIDHFDPFVVNPTKVCKEPKTFDEIIQSVDKVTTKTSKSDVSKPRVKSKVKRTLVEEKLTEIPVTTSMPKSILCLKKRKKPKNKKTENTKRIQINLERNITREFVHGEHEDTEIIVKLLSFDANEDELPDDPQLILSKFQRDPLHKVVANVLQWDVDWLKDTGTEPSVNGGHMASPTLQRYDTFTMYQSVMVPLMMHELWASVQADFAHRSMSSSSSSSSFTATVKLWNDERRGYSFRKNLICEAVRDPYKNIINMNDLVIVSAGTEELFAFVTEVHNKNNIVHFAMEMSVDQAVLKLPHCPNTLRVRVAANIRSEMKLFSAVFTLKNCPLREYILNPLDGANTPKSRLPYKFVYNGYEPLTEIQQNVLENVYAECKDRNKQFTLIEGPPGTGKSRLIVALILQMIFSQQVGVPMKILLCAQSNSAVDVLVKKLIKIRSKISSTEKAEMLNIVRHGVVEKMHPDVRLISAKTLSDRRIIDDCKDPGLQAMKTDDEMMTQKIGYLLTSAQTGTAKDKIKELQNRQRVLRDQMQKKAQLRITSKAKQYTFAQVVKDATVVCTTLSSAINLLTYDCKFDVCIVDEASQCTEPWTLVPLLFSLSSMILVGDSQQLPPVVLSGIARKFGLDQSLFSRIQDAYIGMEERPNVYSLREQFRMNPAICRFSNEYFYEGKLNSNSIVTDNTFNLKPYNVFSLNFVQSKRNTYNYQNENEAEFVIEILNVIRAYADPMKNSYAIITPYTAQKEQIEVLLRKYSLPSSITVNTIDSYQGQERDIIIISNARTTGTGFLVEPKRLNVAMTRARKCLVICGNFDSLKHVPVWAALLQDAKAHNCLYKRTNDKLSYRDFIEKHLIKANIRDH